MSLLNGDGQYAGFIKLLFGLVLGVLQALVVGLLAWALTNIVQVKEDVAVIKAQIPQAFFDRYTGAQAESDKSIFWGELNDHENRIRVLEEHPRMHTPTPY